MALLFHIILALGSLVVAGAVYLRPGTTLLRVSYALIVLTLLTGTYLTWTDPAHAGRAVITGVAYLGVALGGTVAAQRRLTSSDGKTHEP